MRAVVKVAIALIVAMLGYWVFDRFRPPRARPPGHPRPYTQDRWETFR